ncbi:MAG: hemerythrin domain-containing protein [Rhodospirillales bacterium]|nr:hemerythrin domain-containing protein [Rhodospirillales bacterium]
MTIHESIGATLHAEHLQTLSAMDALDGRTAGEAKRRPLDALRPEDKQLVEALVAVIDSDVCRHFRFEEEELFPKLEKHGMGDVTRMLIEEHATIKGFIAPLKRLCQTALERPLGKSEWVEFRNLAMDLVNSITFHIQKEEMGIIRGMEMLLDEASCRELVCRYSAY